MDCIREFLPILRPFGSIESSVSNEFSGCLTCHPFGVIQTKASRNAVKPSQEVKTISSLVEKFATYPNYNAPENSTSNTNRIIFEHQPKFHRQYQPSIRYEINHEKFHPCNSLRHQENTYSRNSDDIDTFNAINRNDFQKPIVAPPRRKKHSMKRLSESSTDTSSFESNLEHEIKKNSRNLELSNLDQLDNSRNNILYSVNYVINNKCNKSGCSNIDIVSNSLENEMYFRQFGSNSNICKVANNGNGERYCQNKVYYKNGTYDKYGNYDPDEVLVCESIIAADVKNESTKKQTPPMNSTYTKFYTDSFYQDREDGTSNGGSLDAPFEQISQLQPDSNAFFRNIFKTKKPFGEKPDIVQFIEE